MSIKTLIMLTSDPQAIPRAAQVLEAGGLIVFPTDTVYGLACCLNNSQAIDRIYEVKGRSPGKAIAVLLADVDQLDKVTPLMGEKALKLANQFWPGALTLVVPRHPDLPSNLSPTPTIGVRIPDHPFTQKLLSITGPLATTSANLSGVQDSQTAQDVLAQLGGKVDLILDGGQAPGGIPSTVINCTVEPPTILREGAIPSNLIYQIIA
jgi:L-threonylcarbamoyladenylate synthase